MVESEVDIARLKSDPAYFVKVVMGIKLYDYQQDFVRAVAQHDGSKCNVEGCTGAPHKKLVLAWGRQSGKTTAVACLAIWWALTHAGTDLTPYTTLIVSRGLRQAFIMFRTVRYLIAGNHVLEEVVNRERTTKSEIWFNNKSRVIALPCGHDGSTIRGYTTHVLIMDEAAYVKEHIITEVAFPMLATTEKKGGGVVILLSTPAGRDTIFFKAFHTYPGWWRSRIPSSRCPAIKQSFLDERRVEDPWGFRQEYEVEFIDDATAWLPMKLLNEKVIDKMDTYGMIPETAIIAEDVKTGQSYYHLYGCDLGKVRSHSVIAIVRKEPGSDGILRYRLVYLHEFPLVVEESDTVYAQVEDWTYKVGRVFNLENGAIDATNNVALADQIARKLPMIEGVKFTDANKQDMMVWLRNLCEQGRLIIPYNHHKLVTQMNGEKYELRGDKLIFEAPTGGNDDMLWALALALYSDRMPDPPMVVARLNQEYIEPEISGSRDFGEWFEELHAKHGEDLFE